MLNINLKQLEAFVQVVDQGSFRKAAARLYTSQPNISSRISSLEDAVGCQLMQRQSGQIQLTAKGTELLPYARQALAAADSFVSAADQPALYNNIIRLGVTELVAHSWLHPFLARVNEKFPNLLVELTVDLAINLYQSLDQGTTDLALISDPILPSEHTPHGSSGTDTREYEAPSKATHAGPAPPAVVSGANPGKRLGSSAMVWVASPALQVGKDRQLMAADLVRHPILTHARSTKPFRQIESHFAAQPQINARLLPSSSLAACLQMAVNSLGVSVLPETMIEQDLAQGRLRKLDYPWTPDDLIITVHYDPDTVPAVVPDLVKIAEQVAMDWPAAGPNQEP